MKKFAQSIGIIQDFNYEYLNKLLINKDMANFIEFYKINQFTLSVTQRKDIQKKIKDKCDLPIITKNFIPENIKDTKEIFVGICLSICNIQKCIGNDFPEKLK